MHMNNNKELKQKVNTLGASLLFMLLFNVSLFAQVTAPGANTKPTIKDTALMVRKNPTPDLSKQYAEKPVNAGGVPIDYIAFDPDIDLASQIPSLDSLIVIALNQNPSLRFEKESVKRMEYSLKNMRFVWLNGLTGFYNYSYGNQTNLNTVNADGSVLNNSLGVGYRVGINFTLPATELVTRPYRMKQYKAEVEMAKAKKEEEEMTLRRLIIQDYFNLLAAQKLLWIRTQDVESAKLTSEIATVEMKRGKIHPQELSRLKNLQALAESNLEMSKKDFMTYYYVLENWVGVKLNTLKIKKGVGK